MSIWLLLNLILAIGCIVHLMQHEYRNKTWLYLVLFFPFIGPLAYIATSIYESKPRPRQSKLSRIDQITLEPTIHKQINRLQAELSFSGNWHTRQRLADLYFQQGRLTEAKELYENCLTEHPDDLETKIDIAYTCFYLDKFEETKKIIDHLHNQGFESIQLKILAAFIAEKEETLIHAEELFQDAIEHDNGIEAECQYALFLQRLNKKDQANEQFQKLAKKKTPSPNGSSQEWNRIIRENA